MEPWDPNRFLDTAKINSDEPGKTGDSEETLQPVGEPVGTDQPGDLSFEAAGPTPLPLIVPTTLTGSQSQIDGLMSLRNQAEHGNLHAAGLPFDTFSASTGSETVKSRSIEFHGERMVDVVSVAGGIPGHSFVASPLPASVEPRSVNVTTGSEVWKSLVWLALMIMVFLAAITAGPRVVEQYQYAATRGKMRAQYEAATDMLSKVSLRESALSSELVVHRIRPSVVSIQAGSKARNRYRQTLTRGQGFGDRHLRGWFDCDEQSRHRKSGRDYCHVDGSPRVSGESCRT